jgi:protein SCO1/2
MGYEAPAFTLEQQVIMVRILLMVLALQGCSRPLPAPIRDAPTFELTDQNGAVFSSNMLKGTTYIASFIFTNCPSICPTLTTNMAKVAAATEGEEIAFVSFSIDPETDTPAVLKKWSSQWEVDQDRWHLLTGDLATIEEVAFGYMQGVHRPADKNMQISHSTRFVVVDKNGRIRAMPESNAGAVATIARFAKQLDREVK